MNNFARGSVRKTLFALVFLASALAARADYNPPWSAIGPTPIPNGQTTNVSQNVSGRVTVIAVHPTNANIAYVGTAQGGVFRTLDGGTNWTPILDGADSLAIGALRLAPSDPTTLFVGTGEAYNNPDGYYGVGMYVVRNAETTADVTGPFNKNSVNSNIFAGNSISQILVSASDANTILVSTNQGRNGKGGGSAATIANRGVFRSTNALSASPTFFPLISNDARIFDMVADPANLNNVLVATPDALYQLTNAFSGTITFTAMFTPPAPFSLVRFALNKVGATTTALAVTSEAQGGFPPTPGPAGRTTRDGTLRRATYNASTWSAWSAPIAAANGFADTQAFYDMAVAVDPGDANKIYIGGTASDFYGATAASFESSTNGGTSFTKGETGLHSDTHAITVAPSNPSTIYFGSDGGIWKSTNSGVSWTSLSNSTFSATQFQNIAVHPTDRNFMLGGTQDNGTEYMDSNGAWTQAALGDGGACLIDHNATDTTNVTMYHTYFNVRQSQIAFEQRDTPTGTWIFRGYNGTTSNNGIVGTNNVNFYAPMALGPGSPFDVVYFGTDRLYRSLDKGATMSGGSQPPLDPSVSDTSIGTPISSISISPQNDNVRLVGLNNGKVFATTNGFSTLTNITGSIPAKYIGRVLIDPSNSNTAYVALSSSGLTSGQQIWKTTNLSSGATWSASSIGIPDIPVNALAIDPSDSNKIYAGTDNGVYASVDAGANWYRFGTGFPHLAVWDLAIQPSSRILRVGTHGRGIYETLLDAPHIAPTVTVTSPAHQSSIASFATVSGTAVDHSGTGIAGNSVNFTLFHVSSGQYWSGTTWVNNQVQISTPITPNTNVWTYNGQLPNNANGSLRTGQYALSASTRDNNNDNSVPQSGVNNIIFTVDTSPPTVTIASPANGSVISGQSYNFSGTANDDFAVNRVTLFLRRNSDNTYWNGSGWVPDSLQANLSSAYNSSSHSWVASAALPVPGTTMANGSYNFQALAIDNAGNSTYALADVTVDFHIQNTWTGAANDGQWGNGANWSGGVPTSDMVVTINGGSISNTSLGSVTVYGVNLNGGSLTTSGMFITRFNLAGGSLVGGAVNINGAGGTMNWSGGQFSGTLGILNGATLAIDTTGGPFLDSGALNNAGTITISASNLNNAYYFDGSSSTITNQSGGRIQIGRDGQFTRNRGQPPLFNNQNGGTIVKIAGASGRSETDWALDNNGVVQADVGTLSFNAGSSAAGSGGTFNATTASARVELGGGTHTLKAGARFAGPGRGRISGARVTLSGAVSVGAVGAPAGGFEQTGGLLNGPGSLSVIGGGGSCLWSGGAMSTTYSLGAGATLAVDTTGGPFLDSGSLTNAGTITISASNPNNAYYFDGSTSTITNQSGGRIEIARDGQFTRNRGQTPLFSNQSGGTIVKTAAATGQSLSDWALDNNGTVQADAGTLSWAAGSSTLGGAGTFNTTTASARVELSGGTHILKPGAIFTGSGRGKVTGGTVNISGTITLGASGASTGGFEMVGGSIVGGPGSVLNQLSGGTFAWSGGSISTTLNINNGTLLAVDTSTGPFLDSGTLNNTGTMIISASNPNNLSYFDGNNSLINNLPGGRIEIARDGQIFRNRGQQPVLVNQSTIVKTAGTGTTVFSDFRLQNAANASFGSNVGTLSLVVPSTFDQGSNLIGLGRLNLQSDVTYGGQINVAIQVHFAGGTSTCNAATFVQVSGGSMFWDTGTFTGSLSIPSGSAMTIDTAGNPFFDSGTLNNAGTITIGSSSSSNSGLFDGNNFTLTNQAGALFQVVSPLYLRNRSQTPSIVNGGTLRINTSNVAVNSDWNFTQSAGGILDLQVSGPAASQYSRLLVNAAANLSGTINVNLLNGYLPNGGEVFPLVAYTSRSGQFANVNAGGFKFTNSYSASAFTLNAISQPTLAEWKAGYFGDPNGAAAADTATPARDGVANLLKFALGLNPNLPGASALPSIGQDAGPGAVAETEGVASIRHGTLNFRRIDPADVTYVVQASDNAGAASSWTEVARLNVGANAWFGTATVLESGTGSTRQVTVTDSFTFAQKAKRFYRLVVSH